MQDIFSLFLNVALINTIGKLLTFGCNKIVDKYLKRRYERIYPEKLITGWADGNLQIYIVHSRI